MTRIDRLTLRRLAHLPTPVIARKLAVSERTVQRALNELRNSGLAIDHGRTRGKPVSEIDHGGPTGYRYGCRCQACRAKHREIMAVQRASRKARGLPPGDPRHGTENGAANWGCSCPACLAVNRARNAKQRRAREKRKL